MSPFIIEFEKSKTLEFRVTLIVASGNFYLTSSMRSFENCYLQISVEEVFVYGFTCAFAVFSVFAYCVSLKKKYVFISKIHYLMGKIMVTFLLWIYFVNLYIWLFVIRNIKLGVFGLSDFIMLQVRSALLLWPYFVLENKVFELIDDFETDYSPAALSKLLNPKTAKIQHIRHQIKVLQSKNRSQEEQITEQKRDSLKPSLADLAQFQQMRLKKIRKLECTLKDSRTKQTFVFKYIYNKFQNDVDYINRLEK